MRNVETHLANKVENDLRDLPLLVIKGGGIDGVVEDLGDMHDAVDDQKVRQSLGLRAVEADHDRLGDLYLDRARLEEVEQRHKVFLMSTVRER